MKESRIYSNKFSFGISLNIELDDYKRIINDYKGYINNVYFSLPLGDEFHTRKGVIEEYSQQNSMEKLKDILNLFKENNIGLEAVLNQYGIQKYKIIEALEYVKNIPIDSMCVLDEYAETVRKYYPSIYLVSSFNNIKLHTKKKIYDQVVVGRRFLRDINTIKEIKENGVDVKFLLNNGCSFNCGTCRMGNLQCKECFERNLIKFSAEELYALQSFFPFEIDILQSRLGNYECIKEFKISNRPCTYEYLNDCLNSYIYGKGKEEQYIQKSKMNYRLWGRLGHFNQYLEKMNINMIKKIKKEIWDML